MGCHGKVTSEAADSNNQHDPVTTTSTTQLTTQDQTTDTTKTHDEKTKTTAKTTTIRYSSCPFAIDRQLNVHYTTATTSRTLVQNNSTNQGFS